MERKRCSACERRRSLSKFSKDKGAKDGLCHRCRDCTSKYLKEHRKGKPGYNDAHAKKWRERNPLARKAHREVEYALDRGDMKRLPCQWPGCNDPKTDGHHDDYAKPRDVLWLCRPHHHEHHAKMREARA